LTFLAVAVGCSSGGSDSDPAGSLPGAQGELAAAMATVLLDSDAVTEGVLESQLNVLPATSGSTDAVSTVDVSFSRSVPCPAGGNMMVEATLQATRDTDTGVMEASFTGTRTLTACAFNNGEHTITVDGQATFDAFRRRVNGVPDGPQTSHYFGDFTAMRDDGETFSCSFDIEIVRDPTAGTRSINGTMCDNPFGRSVVWQPR
jgi:hypothetical protein